VASYGARSAAGGATHSGLCAVAAWPATRLRSEQAAPLAVGERGLDAGDSERWLLKHGARKSAMFAVFVRREPRRGANGKASEARRRAARPMRLPDLPKVTLCEEDAEAAGEGSRKQRLPASLIVLMVRRRGRHRKFLRFDGAKLQDVPRQRAHEGVLTRLANILLHDVLDVGGGTKRTRVFAIAPRSCAMLMTVRHDGAERRPIWPTEAALLHERWDDPPSRLAGAGSKPPRAAAV